MKNTGVMKSVPRIVFGLALTVLVLLALTLSCQRDGLPQGSSSFYEMEEVYLNELERKHVMDLLMPMLEGGQPPVDRASFPVVYEQKRRGVFVSYSVAKSRAIVGFGLGDSLYDALKDAVVWLKKKSGDDPPWDTGVLKVDVIKTSGKSKTFAVDDPLDIDRTLRGLLFDVQPPIALLPEEIMGWNLLNDEGKYMKNSFRKYMKFQGGSRLLADSIRDGEKVPYTTFTTLSFGTIDGDFYDLFRGKRLYADYPAERFRDSAVLGAEYLARIVDDKGKYIYEYRAELDRDRKRYNMLRHAGTTYSLLEAYEVTGRQEFLEAAKRAVQYLIGTLRKPKPGDAEADFLAVVEKNQAKLGGCGLGLICLTKYQDVSGDDQYLDEMMKMANFIYFMQEDNGDFKSKYYYRPGPHKPFRSLYYPGEAMLGLVRLYEIVGDKKLLDCAERGMDYIVLERDKDRTPSNVEHDHWVMIAINELYRVLPKDHYIAHLKKLGTAMRMKQKTSSKFPDYVGSFYTPPRSAPAATRNEGMIAGYNLLRHLNDEETPLWREAVLRTGRHQFFSQFTGENAMYLRNPPKAFGGFKEGLKEHSMRIDYTQHNISSLLGIYAILKEKEE